MANPSLYELLTVSLPLSAVYSPNSARISIMVSRVNLSTDAVFCQPKEIVSVADRFLTWQ